MSQVPETILAFSYTLFLPRCFPIGKVVPIAMQHALAFFQPLLPIFCAHFNLRFQLRRVQIEIVDRSNSHKQLAGKLGACSIPNRMSTTESLQNRWALHQTPTDATKAVCHLAPTEAGRFPREPCKFVLPADVIDRSFLDDEDGGEHGGG